MSRQTNPAAIPELEKALVALFNKFGLRAIPTGSKSPIDSETMTLENAFGSVKPINRPENFKKLREVSLEEHLA